jgi:YesN/AraC family two-component response regulator
MFKVLLIDDEEIVREGLRLTVNWQSLGCGIEAEACDGEEGIKLIKLIKPDIIFTDIRMPGIDGLNMISQIKSLIPECKIIILTGYRDFEYAQEAIRVGAFRFILKPSKTDEITQAITEAVDQLKKSRVSMENLNNISKKIKELYGIKTDDNSITKLDNKDINKSSYLVKKAIDFMKENYKNDISLSKTAEILFISTWHLSKILKKETGSTFVDLLNEIRINEAKKLLIESNCKIYEVSEMVGFEDVSYFTRLFKKLVGLTPMEYKNANIDIDIN